MSVSSSVEYLHYSNELNILIIRIEEKNLLSTPAACAIWTASLLNRGVSGDIGDVSECIASGKACSSLNFLICAWLFNKKKKGENTKFGKSCDSC